MNRQRAAYEAGRAELKRRELIERMHDGRLVLRVPFGMNGTTREQVLAEAMASFDLPWGQLEDQGTHQLIHVSGINRRTIPKQLTGAGVALIGDARDVDWSRLLPPFASAPIGHASFAHTKLFTSENFTYTHYPLSDHANWTYLETDNYLGSNGQTVLFMTPGASARATYYLHVPSDMSAESTDYSSEAILNSTYASSKIRQLGVSLRQGTAGNCYYLTNRVAATSTARLVKRVNTANTTLSDTTTNYANSVAWRLQAVRTILTVWIDGKLNVDVLDSAISAAGSAGIFGYQDANSTGAATLDDFAVYVEAGPGAGGTHSYGGVT